MKDLNTFRDKFKEQYNFVCEDLWKNKDIKYLAITAPVKSGKRIIKIIQALFGRPTEKHYYITSLNRKDIEKQKDELMSYGIEVGILKNKKDIKKQFDNINQSSLTCKTIVHIDESDYGTDKKQLLGDFHNLIKNLFNVYIRYYSATNEEVIFSNGSMNIKKIEFIPGASYRGAKWYLDNNLVYEAKPFFEKNTFSAQAIEAIELLKKSDKKVGIVRLIQKDTFRNLEKAYKNGLRNQLIKDGIEIWFIDQRRRFKWEEGCFDNGAYIDSCKNKIILAICQTCTRSTEIGFHNNIVFLHDYRTDTTNYNTCAQAFLRVAHYNNSEIENYIKVYADISVFKLASDQKYSEFVDRNLSSRITSTNKKIKNIEVFSTELEVKSKYPDLTKDLCSTNSATDLAAAVLNESIRHDNRYIFLDQANPSNTDSWMKLKIKCPEYIGKYLVIKASNEVISDHNTNKKSMYI